MGALEKELQLSGIKVDCSPLSDDHLIRIIKHVDSANLVHSVDGGFHTVFDSPEDVQQARTTPLHTVPH